MIKFSSPQGLLHTSLVAGTLLSVTLSGSAAADSDRNAVTAKARQQNAATTPDDDAVMTVLSPVVKNVAGSSVTLSAAEMQQRGGNDFGSIMRYQPLIGAVGSSGGSSTGKRDRKSVV